MSDVRLNTGLVEMGELESWELLSSEEYGRIGVVVGARPEIFPVNFSVDTSKGILFRTVAGMKLAAAVNHHVVFEVDKVDRSRRTGAITGRRLGSV